MTETSVLIDGELLKQDKIPYDLRDYMWNASLHAICKIAFDVQDCIRFARLHYICKIKYDMQDQNGESVDKDDYPDFSDF